MQIKTSGPVANGVWITPNRWNSRAAALNFLLRVKIT